MAADAGKDPAQEELERRMMELQMMDLGTQRREYISTVDAPSRFASVSKEELERTRRANVDPTIRRLAEQNKSRLSAWNTVHETLGDDVETEDLDSLMDGQSHRARLAELVKQHGGQNYVEPEPLYNGPSPSHNGGNMAGSTSKPRANASKPATDNVPKARPGPGSNGGITKKKRGGGGGGGGGAGGGTAGIVNAAGRTRKAAGPNNRAPAPASTPVVQAAAAAAELMRATKPFAKPQGKKGSAPKQASQLDPAKNPNLLPGQLPTNVARGPTAAASTTAATQTQHRPPSAAASVASTKSQQSAHAASASAPRPGRAAAQKPPRVPVGALTFSGSMAHPDDFMKALQAAMPKTAPPTTHPGRPPVAFNFPAPRQAPARQPFVVLEDDPAAFMMKAASSTISSPPVTSPAMTAAVAAAPNAQPAAPNAQPATGSRQPPPACTPAGGQASETMTDNAPRPALESEREQQPRQTDEPAMSTTPPANLAPTPQQHAQQPEQVAASKPPPPTENLLDLDIDETATVCSRPLQPSASYDLASLVMDSTAPATPSPPPPPAAHSPPRQQSPGSPPTRKVGRAVEAYLRIFVNYRVELRKLRQFAKRTNLDDDLKEYIIRRKHEVEEDYHVLWEEVIERFPDIDIDDIEEEVLVRSLRVRVAVSDADLENLRKECEISKQQQQQRQRGQQEETSHPHPTVADSSSAASSHATAPATALPAHREQPPIPTTEAGFAAGPGPGPGPDLAPVSAATESTLQLSEPAMPTATPAPAALAVGTNLPERACSVTTATATSTAGSMSMASTIPHPGPCLGPGPTRGPGPSPALSAGRELAKPLSFSMPSDAGPGGLPMDTYYTQANSGPAATMPAPLHDGMYTPPSAMLSSMPPPSLTPAPVTPHPQPHPDPQSQSQPILYTTPGGLLRPVYPTSASTAPPPPPMPQDPHTYPYLAGMQPGPFNPAAVGQSQSAHSGQGHIAAHPASQHGRFYPDDYSSQQAPNSLVTAPTPVRAPFGLFAPTLAPSVWPAQHHQLGSLPTASFQRPYRTTFRTMHPQQAQQVQRAPSQLASFSERLHSHGITLKADTHSEDGISVGGAGPHSDRDRSKLAAGQPTNDENALARASAPASASAQHASSETQVGDCAVADSQAPTHTRNAATVVARTPKATPGAALLRSRWAA